MRSKWMLAIVWVVLFASTVGIRALASSGDDRKQRAAISSERSKIHGELLATPRKSESILNVVPTTNSAEMSISDDALGVTGTVDNEFDARLSAFIRANADGLRVCRKRVMARSTRVTEYFELSFVPRVVDVASAAAPPHVRLDELVLERSTLALSAQDEQCLLDAFKNFSVPAESVPNHRVMYKLCFQSLK